ncbi:YchJ family metal-binding protein [Nonomuraea dietziae]|uniref:YchJ family protein n=1 Tax=Nonomuraea dietziae TaxID=65515 RepID=UPI0033F68D45
MSSCPCGLPAPYDECCGRLHRGEAAAETAEQLMRSRFSAFAVGDADYLLRSWHPSTRPAELAFEPRLRWKRLSIVATGAGGPADDEGTVEFRARFSRRGRAGEMREVSRFARHEGAWVYVNGEVRSSPAR